MKFSTSLTLAAITLMSTTGSTNARIGGNQRELHGHSSALICQDPATYNPTYTPQCINIGHGGYTCQNIRPDGTPYWRCVEPVPTSAPTAPPTPDRGVSCTDPSKYNPTYTPQCINVGSGGYTCRNVRYGGTPEYRCVPPPPTAAPTSQKTIPCHTNHNPTTTPECPSGYTCQALMGANPNTYDGYCREDIMD